MLTRKLFQGFHYLSFCSLMSFEVDPAELGGGSGNESTEDSSEESQGQSEGGYSSFVQELLKDAPQEHLPILEPYIKKFDAGVTRRFQDLSSKYKHYEPLGWDEETTQQMAEVYRVLNDEPERMLEALKEALELDDEEQNSLDDGGDTGQGLPGVPPEIAQQLQEQQQVLEALAQYVLNENSERTQAVEDQEFESYMGLLKKEYGDFDERYVTAMIANGLDGEAAVKQWQAAIQEEINKALAATEGLPPATLSSAGGGAVVQQEPQKLGSYSSKDIRQLIANVVGQANEASQ